MSTGGVIGGRVVVRQMGNGKDASVVEYPTERYRQTDFREYVRRAVAWSPPRAGAGCTCPKSRRWLVTVEQPMSWPIEGAKKS